MLSVCSFREYEKSCEFGPAVDMNSSEDEYCALLLLAEEEEEEEEEEATIRSH